MEYGKKIKRQALIDGSFKDTCESYFNDKISNYYTTYSIPRKVLDKKEALTMVLEAFELVFSNKTNEIDINISFNPKNKSIMLTRKYTIPQ